MGTPSAAIDATYPIVQTIRLDVYVGGGRVSDATGVTVTSGLSQVNATAEIDGVERPDGAEETDSVEVWAGYQTSAGSGTDIIFKGELAGVTWRHFPGVVPLQARDKFARLRNDWGGEDREYESQDDDAVIRNLAEAAGFDSWQMNIEASDWGALGAWTLGVVEAVVARAGQAFWSLIERIDRLAGMRTFVDRAGNLLRRRVSGNIGAGAIWAYEEGENIISCERQRRHDGIVNHAVVTGLDYEGLTIGGEGVADVRAGNPFLKFPFEFITEAIQDNLIEDDDRALAVAKRTVADKNRRPEVYRLTVPFNPTIVPASVIQITHDVLETASGSRFMVDQVAHRITASPPSAQTTITTLGGALVQAETNIAPVASFVITLFQEAKDTGAGATSIIIVVADGSASYDPDGTTLTYAWTFAVDAGAVTPTAPTTVLAVATITGAATTLTATLVVTDADGATGTFGPQIIPLTKGTLQIEPLYLAWDDGVISASKDGELTWNDYSTGAAATCTAPFAASWGTIWGADNGHVYTTIDDLATAAVDTGAPGGGAVDVTAVWIHELDTTRAWAGLSDGKVYSGAIDTTTPTITWTLAGTIAGSPVYGIREAIGALGSLRAVAGTGYYASEDAGQTWALLHTFTATNAMEMAAGFDQNWASGHNVSSGAVVFAETGTTPTTPGGVDTMHLTFGWRTQAAYGADDVDPANLYSTDSTFAALTDTTVNAPDAVNQMIRSGSIDGPVIYLACDVGPAKWIVPGSITPFFIRQRAGKRCLQIGYGPVQLPRAKVRFVFGTRNITAASGLDGFWEYNFGVWRHITPPNAQWRWLQIVASPYSPNTWLAYGQPVANFDSYNYVLPLAFGGTATLRTGGLSPLWFTNDAGATWTSVTLPESSTATYGGIYAIGFQAQSGRWFAMGTQADGGGTFTAACMWEGTGAGDARFTDLGAGWPELFWVTDGNNGDLLISEADLPGGGTAGRLVYLPNDGDLTTGSWKYDALRGIAQPYGPLDTISGTREFWQASLDPAEIGVHHYTDYREEDPASDVPPTGTLERPADYDGDYRYLAAGDTHLFIMSLVGGATGIYRRPHATWTPTGAPDYAAVNPQQCVTDRQSRRVFVAFADIGGSGDWAFVAHDGAVWSRIELPDAALKTANGGLSGVDILARGAPFCALGEVSLLP